MFRFVLLVFPLAVATLAVDIPEFVTKCAEESKVDINKLKEMKEEDFHTHDFYCFEKCVSEKHGVMNDKGEFMVDNILKNMEKVKDVEVSDEKVKEAVKKCTEEITDSDACDKSSKRGRCFIKEVFSKEVLGNWKKQWENM